MFQGSHLCQDGQQDVGLGGKDRQHPRVGAGGLAAWSREVAEVPVSWLVGPTCRTAASTCLDAPRECSTSAPAHHPNTPWTPEVSDLKGKF